LPFFLFFFFLFFLLHTSLLRDNSGTRTGPGQGQAVTEE
jgi:hypothetical protein